MIELLGVGQSWFTVTMGNVGYPLTVMTLLENLSSTGGIVFLLFGIFSVAFSCVASLNNALSTRIGAFFSWTALFAMTISLMSGGKVAVWSSLCAVMMILHLLQIFSWTFGRRRSNIG
jgi:hypothetical protein